MIVMPKHLTALMLAFSSSAFAYELSEPKVMSHLDEPLNIEIPVSGAEDGYVRLASTHEYLRLGLTPITIPLAITMEGEGANKKAVITSPHKIDNAGFEILVETNQDGKPKFYNIPVMLDAAPAPVIQTESATVEKLAENVSENNGVDAKKSSETNTTNETNSVTNQTPEVTTALTKAEKAKLAKEEKARLKAEKAEKLKQEKAALQAEKKAKAEKIKAEKAEVARIKAEQTKLKQDELDAKKVTKASSESTETSTNAKDSQITVKKVVSYKPSGRTFGPTQTKDTLWSIAGVVGAKGKQQQEMVDAIKTINPTAFFGSKMKTGATLQIPDLASKHYVNVPVKSKEKTATPIAQTTVENVTKSDSLVEASENPVTENPETEKINGVLPTATDASSVLVTALPLATEPVLSLNDDVAEAEGDADPYVIKQMIPVPGVEEVKPVATETKSDSGDAKTTDAAPQSDSVDGKKVEVVPQSSPTTGTQSITTDSKSSPTDTAAQTGSKPNTVGVEVKKTDASNVKPNPTSADVKTSTVSSATPQAKPKPKPKPIAPLPVEKTFVENLIDTVMEQLVVIAGGLLALIALIGGLIFARKRKSLKKLEQELAMMDQAQPVKAASAAIPMATVESTSFVVKSLHEDLEPVENTDVDQPTETIETVAVQPESSDLNFDFSVQDSVNSVEKTPNPISKSVENNEPEQSLSFDFLTPESEKQIPSAVAPISTKAEVLDEGLSFDFSIPEPAAAKPVAPPVVTADNLDSGLSFDFTAPSIDASVAEQTSKSGATAVDAIDEGLSFDFSIPEPVSESQPVVSSVVEHADTGLSFDFSVPEVTDSLDNQARNQQEKDAVAFSADALDAGLSFDFSTPDEPVEAKKQSAPSASVPVMDDLDFDFEIPAADSLNVAPHRDTMASETLATPFDFAIDDNEQSADYALAKSSVNESSVGSQEHVDNVFKSSPVEIHEAMPIDDFAEFNLPEDDGVIEMPLVSSDETNTVKLELAEAYLNFDPELAEPILLEVLKDGSTDHKAKAQQFLDQIYAKHAAQTALGETTTLRSEGNSELLPDVTAVQLKTVVEVKPVEDEDEGNESDSVKLELAEAYLTFDATLAKPLLLEVLRDGSAKQKAKAQALLNEVG